MRIVQQVSRRRLMNPPLEVEDFVARLHRLVEHRLIGRVADLPGTVASHAGNRRAQLGTLGEVPEGHSQIDRHHPADFTPGVIRVSPD